MQFGFKVTKNSWTRGIFFIFLVLIKDNWTMKPTDIDTTPTAMARDGKPFVITVGREFGSGGRELARALADELGIADRKSVV